MDWAEETYSDVGTVQGHNFCVMGNDDKIKHLDKVTVTSTNWWAYLQHRKCWDSIKDTLYKLYIGKQGIHQTPRQYASDGFDNIHMEDYDSDSDRKDFNLFTGNYKDLITENELSGLEGLTVIKN